MNEIRVRVLGAGDLDALLQVSRNTFRETFSEQNSAEDLAAYIEERLSRSQLKGELEHPDSIFAFAEEEGRPMGYLKLNRGAAQTEDRGPRAIELERIYVLREAQGLGIGAVLLQWGLAWAQDQMAEELWLGVWEHNGPALKFYAKHGFELVGSHVFMLGSDAQTDFILRKRLDLET
jgi:GNAT superfamily N-acetyltransferase